MLMNRDQNLNEIIADHTNPELFEQLYTDFFTPIYRYVITRLHDRDVSIDIVQTVFMKAFEHKESIRSEHALPYLYTIARNQVIDHIRKKHGVNLSDFDEFIEHVTDESMHNPEQMAVRENTISLVQNMLAQLPELQREAITLHYIADRSYKEMAEITGKSEATLRQSVSRGLRALQEYYTSHSELYEHSPRKN